MEKELTITPEYIHNNIVFVAEVGGKEFIGQGIGSELISFAKEICRKTAIDRLLILSDPNAKGFYDKLGGRYIEESPSSIAGRRVLLYELDI